MQYKKPLTLPATTPVVVNGSSANVRWQFDFTGSTGSVNIEADAGAGFRIYDTILLTDLNRLPYVLEGEFKQFRITATVACDCYICANRV